VRIRTLAVTLGAAVALGAAVIPAARGAAADAVTVTSVATGPDSITIATTSDTAITALSVDLTTAANPDVLTLSLPDFTLTAGTGTGASTWTLNHSLSVSQLPPGTYGLNVTAQDTGGGSGSDDSATFAWLATPTVTLTASSPTFSYDSPSVTFSGTLALTNPDGSGADPAQAAGLTLQLTDGSGGNAAVTTGAGGAFSIVISHPDSGAAYVAAFAGTTAIVAGKSAPVTVTATKDQAEVGVRVSATQLNYGQSLTISGTAQYAPGAQLVPLAGGTVAIYAGPAGTQASPLATVTTDAQGDYTATVAAKATGSYYVYAGGVPGDAFLDEVLTQAVASTPTVSVALPLKITALKASLSPFAELTLKGCLVVGNGSLPPALTMRVESAAKPAGPWHAVASVHGLGSPACGSGSARGLPFDYQVKVPMASAYYRLDYAGSSGFQPARSATVHEAKTLTKITNFTISPRSVAKRKYVKVSGRLWRYAKGWHPMASQRIWILARYQNKWYYYATKPATNSAGKFSGRFQVYFSGPWLAEFMGSQAYFASASGRLTVTATSAAVLPELGTTTLAAAGLRPVLSAGAVLADTGLRLAG
jgi:hypothetical protein